jgi:hypothetical protein
VEDWVMMAAAGVLTFAVMEAIKLTRQRIERHAK